MSKIDNIYKLLSEGERVTLECKKATKGVPSSLWDTYSAFANTYGGTILLGVVGHMNEHDNAKRFEIVGVEAADKIRNRKCLWNGTDQKLICCCHAFAYQGGIAAEEIDTDFFCRTIQGLCNRYKIFRRFAGCRTNQGNRGNGNSLVHNRDTELALNLFTHRNQISGSRRDFIVDFTVEFVKIGVNAV